MGLRDTFKKGVNTIFKVFKDAVKSGTYSLINDDGFSTPTPTSCKVRCIFEKFTEKDVALLSFSKLIQPTDIKGLIPEEDVTLKMGTTGVCSFEGTNYTVEGFDLDPMSVIYTVLLRNT